MNVAATLANTFSISSSRRWLFAEATLAPSLLVCRGPSADGGVGGRIDRWLSCCRAGPAWENEYG